MVNLIKLQKIVDKHNKQNKKTIPNYEKTRARLCKLVDKYGFDAVALATGLTLTTVKQHYRNVTGTSMISLSRLEQADEIFSEYTKVKS